MIELLFSDSATGSLKCAKALGDGTAGGVGIILTIDENGNETQKEFIPQPYTDVKVEGSPEDVHGIWLCGNVGDISDMSNWKARIDSVNKFFDVYGSDDFEVDWSQKAALQAEELVEKLKYTAETNEKIRIWWSGNSEETCGFYWAMSILQNTNENITSVKLPEFIIKNKTLIRYSGTGELAPEDFSDMLCFEQPVTIPERRYYAQCWNKLVKENAPLRAVVSGDLYSVPEDFYDFILRKFISDEPLRVAHVIGTALGNGPKGVNDWWYANRLQKMISKKEVEIIEYKKTFYGSLIKKV